MRTALCTTLCLLLSASPAFGDDCTGPNGGERVSSGATLKKIEWTDQANDALEPPVQSYRLFRVTTQGDQVVEEEHILDAGSSVRFCEYYGADEPEEFGMRAYNPTQSDWSNIVTK